MKKLNGLGLKCMTRGQTKCLDEWSVVELTELSLSFTASVDNP